MGGRATEPGLIEVTLNGLFDDVSLVATGGDGHVYRARQRSTNRVVAVKVLTAATRSLHDEVSVHASVSDHPNVLTLFDAGRSGDGIVYLVCEYAPSSVQRQVRSGPIEPGAAVRLGTQIADALAFIHRRGVVHGDLSPANVLIGLDGRPRLADFGASLRHGATPPTLDPIRGSLPFVAPEVLEGARPTEASDVYGAALIVWALVEGRAPFQDGDVTLAAAVSRIGIGRLGFDRLRERPELRRAADALEHATDPDPTARPTAAELAARLEVRTPDAPIVLAAPPSRRGRLTVAVLAAVAAVGGGLAFAAAEDPPAQALAPAVRSELCADFAETQRAAADEMRTITADLRVVDTAPTVAVEQFLAIPNRFADRARPVLRAAGADPRTRPWTAGLSDDALRRLVLSDAATKLSSGRFLFDDVGQPTSEIDRVPPPLKAAVAAYSSVMSFAHVWCPDIDFGLVEVKTALVDSVRGVFEGPRSAFFSDLTTADRIDELTVEIMMTTSGDYFRRLIAEHPEWLVTLMDHRAGIRSRLLQEWHGVAVSMLRMNPQLVETLWDSHPEWLTQIVLAEADGNADALARLLGEFGSGLGPR